MLDYISLDRTVRSSVSSTPALFHTPYFRPIFSCYIREPRGGHRSPLCPHAAPAPIQTSAQERFHMSGSLKEPVYACVRVCLRVRRRMKRKKEKKAKKEMNG